MKAEPMIPKASRMPWAWRVFTKASSVVMRMGVVLSLRRTIRGSARAFQRVPNAGEAAACGGCRAA
jgi:hypothetical protein